MIYQVKPGDSIVDIAIAYTGCPKCARTLVLVNPTKPYLQLSNGFLTFQELYIGEYLNLPDSWFDGTNKQIDKTSWPWPPGFDENWQQWYYRR